MENVLLTLVIVLLVLLVFMMGGAIFVGWRLLQKKSTPPELSVEDNEIPSAKLPDLERLHPEVQKRMLEAQRIKARLHAEATCHVHPKEPSEGACAICDQYFCKSCLKIHGNLLFCREHVAIFLNAPWSEVHSVKSTPQEPEAGVAVVEWKKKIWEQESIPLYVQTHYKINLDGDQIESWLVVFARELDAPQVKKQLAR